MARKKKSQKGKAKAKKKPSLLPGEIAYHRTLTAEEKDGISELRKLFASHGATAGKQKKAGKQADDSSTEGEDSAADVFDWVTLEYPTKGAPVEELFARHWDATELLDQAHVLRFLRARKFVVPEAAEQMVRDLEWRRVAKPRELDPETEFPEAKAMGFGVILPSRTKKGHGFVQLWPATHTPGDVDDVQMLKLLIWAIEQIVAETPAGCDPRYLVVYDRMKMARKNQDLALLKKFGALLADHYPETIEEVAILESDFLFRTVWKVAKYFFDPVTAAKVKTPTGSREDVKEKYFLEHFDEASLPEIYGGGLSHEDCGYYEYPSICEVNGIDIPKKKLSKKEKAADALGMSVDDKKKGKSRKRSKKKSNKRESSAESSEQTSSSTV